MSFAGFVWLGVGLDLWFAFVFVMQVAFVCLFVRLVDLVMMFAVCV